MNDRASSVADTLHNSSISMNIATAGLYIFSFSALFSQAGFYTGLWLMLGAFVWRLPRNWGSLSGTPVFWVAVAISVYIFGASFTNSRAFLPQLSTAEVWRTSWDLVAISGCFSVIIAMPLSRAPDTVYRALTLFLAGYLTALLLGTEWNDLTAYLADRPLFGLKSGFGVYTLSALIGVLIFFAGQNSPRSGERHWLISICSLGLIALLLVIFILGQMRGAWMAAVVVLPVLAWSLFLRPGGTALKGWHLVALAVIAVVILWGGYDTISDRVIKEWDVLQQYLADGGESLRTSSASYRIWLWEEASSRFVEKPLFGWGPGTAAHIISDSTLLQPRGNFHSLYLHLLVEIGLIGIGLFALWLALVVRDLYRAHASGQLEFNLFLLVLALISTFAVVSTVQYRHGESGMFFTMFVGALALARHPTLYRQGDAAGARESA